jgi:serine protease
MNIFQLAVQLLILSVLVGCSDDGDSSPEPTPGFNLVGAISGLDGTITLSSNESIFTTNQNDAFELSGNFAVGTEFSVSIFSKPEGQTCSIENGEGTIGELAPPAVLVTCEDIVQTVSGTSSGATGELVLELISGDISETLTVDGDSFVFASSLKHGSDYAVSIAEQPSMQVCTLANESGVVSVTAPLGVLVSCENIKYAVSGETNNLKGSAVLELRSGENSLQQTVSGNSFSFDDALEDGSEYTVVLVSSSVGQTCTLSNHTGTVVATNTNTPVMLSCEDIIYGLSGSVTGFKDSFELTLEVGEESEVLNVSGDSLSFSTTLTYGDSYNVIVSQQPPLQFCRVGNASGRVLSNGAVDLEVVCSDPRYYLPVSLQGLSGTIKLSLIADIGNELKDVTEQNFTFDTPLKEGENYHVSIAQQPEAQTCSISNNAGTVQVTGITTVEIACSDLSAEKASVSGTISIAANTLVDSDINDPGTPLTSNSSFVEAQVIPNIVTVQGFASADATGKDGDNFEDNPDLKDYYRVALHSGQSIRLQVVDFESFDVQGVYKGDLDLYLYDSEQNLISFSDSINEFEAITVEDSGNYFVAVEAFSGISKYVLNIESTSLLTGLGKSADFVPNEAIVKMNSQFAISSFSSLDSNMSLHHQDSSRANLINFSEQVTKSSVQGSESVAVDELALLNPDSYQKYLTTKRIKELSLQPQVSFIEPNYIRRAQLVPNDEFYPQQWHYPAMSLPQAWDITTGYPDLGEESVVVAVIDTGVFLNHSDLRGQLIQGYDFIKNESNSVDGDGIDNNPDDPGDGSAARSSSWHGTHVAGTIAANSNNDIGVAGVSWGAKIMPIRALGVYGGEVYDLIQSVRYAAGLSNDSGTIPEKPADIINMSLGGTSYSEIESLLYQEVYDKGIVVVASAGNDTSAAPSYPASYNGVISVSALDVGNNLAPYSNFGTNIDIAAPGGNTLVDNTGDGQPDGVLSTLVDDSSGSRKSIIDYYQGTSMAAPHVAGMIALMKAIYPELTASNVEALLQNGLLTDDIGDAGRDNNFGFGAANALKAVQAAYDLDSGDEEVELPASIVATPASLNFGSLNSAKVTLSNKGAGSPRVLGIDTSEDWIDVVEDDLDSAGLGVYDVLINRDGLSDGLYVGRIYITFENASPISIYISMMVGTIDTSGSLAKIFALVLDSSTNETVAFAIATDNGDSTVDYTISDVPAGRYNVVAGTDIDNDNVICQSGEACGAYPSLGNMFTILINGTDTTGVVFNVDIVSGIGTSSASGVQSFKLEQSSAPIKKTVDLK